MKKLLFSFAALLACTLQAESTEGELIENLTYRQRWPWSEIVDVDYVYKGSTPTSVTFVATWEGQNTPVDLVSCGSRGAFLVRPGQNRFEWDPVAAGYGGKTLVNFKVKAEVVANDPRTYLVIDLVNGGYSFLPDVPEGGWTGEYKTRKLVFRRIPAGTYSLGTTETEFRRRFGDSGTVGAIGRGSTMRTIVYTSDYYYQIFALTTAQYARLQNPASNDTSVKPSAGTKYNYSQLRGAVADDGTTAICWPDTGHLVSSDGFVGKLRARTAAAGQAELLVDLPTDAQWQLAMSAGTNTYFATGGVEADSEETITNLIREAFWTKSLDGNDPSKYEVGLKAPNKWGIYDFNVRCEPVLDWANDNGTYVSGTFLYWIALPTFEVDPVGLRTPSALGNRLLRGSEANGSSYAPYSWTLFHRVGVQPNADMYRPPRFVINLKPLIADVPGSGK
jgi:hypothetical protein